MLQYGVVMYAEDSFFTLGLSGRVGLLVLSGCLGAICLLMVWLSRSWRRVWSVLAALVMFWLFVWLSPQIYYFYYLIIFDDLPWQLVVRSPPDPIMLARLLLFGERASLSFHAQGVLGWLLIFCALLPRRKKPG